MTEFAALSLESELCSSEEDGGDTVEVEVAMVVTTEVSWFADVVSACVVLCSCCCSVVLSVELVEEEEEDDSEVVSDVVVSDVVSGVEVVLGEVVSSGSVEDCAIVLDVVSSEDDDSRAEVVEFDPSNWRLKTASERTDEGITTGESVVMELLLVLLSVAQALGT